LPPDVRF